jgi:hypothetical protein
LAGLCYHRGWLVSGMQGQADALATSGFHLESKFVFKDWRVRIYTGQNEGRVLADRIGCENCAGRGAKMKKRPASIQKPGAFSFCPERRRHRPPSRGDIKSHTCICRLRSGPSTRSSAH